MEPSATAPPTAPILTVSGLSIGFDETIIQHDLSFEVARGSIFAIMGGSGSGKSTLLKALIGLLRPTAGSTGPPMKSVGRISTRASGFSSSAELSGVR